MKYTKLIAIAAAAALMCTALSACGKDKTPEPVSTAQENSSALNAITERYPTYIESFSDEFGGFVNGDMDTILTGLGTLNSDNFDEWNTVYQNGLERCQHWHNEVGAAEMLCPEDKKEAHTALVTTVGTIYMILDGLGERVESAQSGDFSELNAMAEQYVQADEIAHEMWDKAIADVQ